MPAFCCPWDSWAKSHSLQFPQRIRVQAGDYSGGNLGSHWLQRWFGSTRFFFFASSYHPVVMPAASHCLGFCVPPSEWAWFLALYLPPFLLPQVLRSWLTPFCPLTLISQSTHQKNGENRGSLHSLPPGLLQEGNELIVVPSLLWWKLSEQPPVHVLLPTQAQGGEPSPRMIWSTRAEGAESEKAASFHVLPVSANPCGTLSSAKYGTRGSTHLVISRLSCGFSQPPTSTPTDRNMHKCKITVIIIWDDSWNLYS